MMYGKTLKDVIGKMPASNKDEVIKIGFTLLLEITTIKQDKTYKTQFSRH